MVVHPIFRHTQKYPTVTHMVIYVEIYITTFPSFLIDPLSITILMGVSWPFFRQRFQDGRSRMQGVNSMSGSADGENGNDKLGRAPIRKCRMVIYYGDTIYIIYNI
jgi:hypothetical protein